MIHNNLLFIHIPRTGGSSIEKMLLLDDDNLEHNITSDFFEKIVDTIMYNDTHFSKWFVGSMRNQHFRRFVMGYNFAENDFSIKLHGIRNKKFLNHLTYLDLYRKPKMYLKNKKKISDFVKFCVVRNPYDRMISMYHFMGNRLTFSEFIQWVSEELDNYYKFKIEPFIVILPQWEFVINENGVNGMDEVLRFEKLSTDLDLFKKKYNLSQKMILPHINSRKRDSQNVNTYYTQELSDIVYHMYKRDFKMFGYKRVIHSH